MGHLCAVRLRADSRYVELENPRALSKVGTEWKAMIDASYGLRSIRSATRLNFSVSFA